MQSRKLIAAVLLLNLGLLFYLVRWKTELNTDGSSPRSATELAPPPETVAVSTPAPGVGATNQFQWQQLESEDYRTYIERLRRIGCPEQTIRDIIIADLEKLLAPRLRAIYPLREELRYWDSEDEELLNNYDAREWTRQERAVEREKRAILRELMGVDLVAERMKQRGQQDYYDRRLSFLSEEKRMQIRDLLEEYNDRRWTVREPLIDSGVPPSAEDRAELRRLRQERDQGLQALLTASELQQYDRWFSESAAQVRHDFYGMNPSEEEFLAIYELRRAFDAQWPRDEIDLDDATVAAQWHQATLTLNDQIKSKLGEARFAEFQRGQDPDFHELNATVSRFKLPREKAFEVYEMKRVFVAQRDRVGFNDALPQDQKNTALAVMAEETERELRQVLGSSAFTYYRRRADWWRN